MDLSLIVDGIPHRDRDKNSTGQNHHPSPIDDVKALITSSSSPPPPNQPSLPQKYDSSTNGVNINEVSTQGNSIASPPTSPAQTNDCPATLDGVDNDCDVDSSVKFDLTRSSFSPVQTRSTMLPSPRLSVSSDASSTSSSGPECLSSAPDLVSPQKESDSRAPDLADAATGFPEHSKSETMALLALTQTQSLRPQNEYQYPCYQQIPQGHPNSSLLLNNATPSAPNGSLAAPIAPSSLTVSGTVMPPPVSSMTVSTDLGQVPYIYHSSVPVVSRISSNLLPAHGHPHAHFGMLPPYPYTTTKPYEIHHSHHYPSEPLSAVGTTATPENPKFKREICNNKNSQRLTKTTTQATISPPAVLPMRAERVPVRSSIDKGKPKANLKTRQFVCDECGRSFCRKSDLSRHVQIHLGIKPNVCKVCGKQFLQRSALTVHIRVHTGEKPYSCLYCNRPFSDSSSLARHRRIHARNQEQPRVFVPASTNRPGIVSSQILPGSARTTSS